MASSRKSNLADTVAAHLAPLLPRHSRILVGLSGGMDSVVLLHLLHFLAPRFDWQLSALHVHHGISQHANAWADFCTELCVENHIPLAVEHVDITSLRADHGIEAAARKLRHAAFSRQHCDCVVLAHHADDQAETLLLQLLRGAGAKGAAAMAMFKSGVAGAPAIVRPLLDISRGTLLEYAHQHALHWVEDESNADTAYPRNFLRHQVLPLLEQKFPAYRDTLTRSAHHFAEAAVLLDELAQQDAQTCSSNAMLDVSALRGFSFARAKNLLRYFLHAQGAPMPQSVQLDEMLHQLLDARQDAAVCVEFGDWQLRRYRGRVSVLHVHAEFDRNLILPWQGEGELIWTPLSALLKLSYTTGQGISFAKLRDKPVTFRLRNGGERLRPNAKASTRSLKNLLQEYALPPWRRERLPLMYCGEELVSVVGVAVAADYQAQSGEKSVLVSCE